MTFLSDRAVERLRETIRTPDLAGTRYRLLEPVARGGMGVVYAAEDVRLARRVALKVLDLPDPTGGLEQRLVQEARVLARLEHPGIVPVHDVGTLADGRVFYAMKFVEGRQVDEHVASVPSLPERLRIVLRICDAVAFAHAHGVVHRDLKPSNIMVGPFGEVLVVDWGLAKLLPAGAEERPSEASIEGLGGAERSAEAPTSGQRTEGVRTAHGAAIGTPGFMPPEQARGDLDQVGARSDVYALGAVLKLLVSTPRGAAGGDTADRGMPRPLSAICAKATAVEPADRYAGVQELAADVSRYLDGLGVAAYRENLFERAQRLLVRYRPAILLIAAYLLARLLLLLALHR